ncbi:MAG: SGNH/GDSL hydrolase family protein [Prevotellaceae bacterium]|nr:SGNH/GDSL hydrolase family protein [Candidatus Minthosoma caballi]
MKQLLLILLLLVSHVSNAQQKILNVIGDSNVANHRCPKEETWHYKMAQMMGLEYNNYGRNGSCIAFDRTHDGKYNFGPAMWVRYADMNPNADYVLIVAGHNDADKVKDNPDSLKMFCDSLDTMLNGIKKHCPKARIGFVSPWYVDRAGFVQLCRVIKKICKRHHVPLLMNYSDKCVIKVRDEAFRKKYFQTANDNAHLNDEGHNIFLPVAKEWFEKKVK